MLLLLWIVWLSLLPFLPSISGATSSPAGLANYNVNGQNFQTNRYAMLNDFKHQQMLFSSWENPSQIQTNEPNIEKKKKKKLREKDRRFLVENNENFVKSTYNESQGNSKKSSKEAGEYEAETADLADESAEENDDKKFSFSHLLKHICVYGLLMLPAAAQPKYLALNPIQKDINNFNSFNPIINMSERIQQENGSLIRLSDDSFHCESTRKSNGRNGQQNIEYKYKCLIKAENLDPTKKYEIMMNSKEKQANLIKIGELDPSKCEIDQNLDMANENASFMNDQREEENHGKWEVVKTRKQKRNKGKQICHQKPILITSEDMEGIIQIEAQREKELIKHYLAMAPTGSTKNRKLLQASSAADIQLHSLPPWAIQEHIFWNTGKNAKVAGGNKFEDGYAIGSVLIRIRHIIMIHPSVPSSTSAPPIYTFSASFSPFYQPDKIIDLGSVVGTPPNSEIGKDKSSKKTVEQKLAASAPAASRNTIYSTTVCSLSPDQVWTLCTWIQTDKADGSSPNREVCSTAYFHDSSSSMPPDVDMGCKTVQKCFLDGTCK